MADAELHIIIRQAGDPEKLGALLNAAIAMQEEAKPVKARVPTGYRCIECYAADGGHESSCSMAHAELAKAGGV